MARKLDESMERTADQPLFGRRDYVKAGVISTAAGAGLVGSTMSGAARSGQTIHVVGTGSLATYEITVSGRLDDAAETAFDARRNISGRNAEGTVEGSVHGYHFEGDIVDVRLEGEAIVYQNGDRVERDTIERR